MVYWLGRTRRFWAMGMLAAVLLSGCGSTGGEPSASSILLTQEEVEEENAAQELQKQIIAIMNLDRDEDNQMGSSSALETAAAFFLSYVLQNPQAYLTEGTDYTDLDGMLPDSTYAFVYDGKLSAVEAGKAILDALQKLDSEGNGGAFSYSDPNSIAIVYGEGENGSVWLALVSNAGSMGPSGSTGTGSGQTQNPDGKGTEGKDSEQEDAGSGEGTGT